MHMNSMTAGALANGDNAHSALGAASSEGAGENVDMKHADLFDRFSKRLKAQVGVDVYQSWFGRLKLHSASKSVVRLTVPTHLFEVLDQQPLSRSHHINLPGRGIRRSSRVEIMVRSASRSTRGPALDARQVGGSEPAAPQSVTRKTGPQSLGQIASPPGPSSVTGRTSTASPLFGSPLDSRYTFDGFVEGASNRVALAAAKTIAEAGAGAVRLQPALHPFFSRSRQDASPAGDCQCCRAQPACTPRRLPHRRIFHVAFRHRDPR